MNHIISQSYEITKQKFIFKGLIVKAEKSI